MAPDEQPQFSLPTGLIKVGDCAILGVGSEVISFTAPWDGRYKFTNEGVWALDPPPHETG